MTSTITLTDFFNGMDYVKTFSLTDSVGNPVDITGYSFKFRARLPESTTNAIDKVMSLSASPSTGIFSLNLSPSDTTLTIGRTYAYQVQGTTNTGVKRVYVVGEFEVQKTF